MSSQSNILNGIRVIDFGHYVAGPMAGMLLADHGADVIKVDPPAGPTYASPANAMWNRGKRRIALDLHDEGDRVIARDLVRDADIVIENFRPGIMAKWGLADADVRKDNPGLIYLSLPGFAPSDPRSAYPAFDGTIFAAVDGFRQFIRYNQLGVQSTTPPREREGAPLPNCDNIPSAYGAVLGTNCVIAALLARRRSGLGQHIEVPLLEAMMQGVGVGASAPLPAMPRTGPIFTPTEIQYECADGRWFVLICSIPSHGEAFFRYVGRTDFIERGLTGKTGFEILGMPEEYEEMFQYLTGLFRTKTSGEWKAVFHELGLPGSIVNTPEEFLRSDLVENTDILVEVAGRDAVLQPNRPVVLSRDEPFHPVPAVAIDHDRQAILKDIVDKSRDRSAVRAIDSTQLSRPPLDEIKVLDLCVILAGPVAGRTLSEFGAEVIKIDDPVRGANSFHDDVNRGKESLFLNLRDTADRDQFWRLVEEADVVVQNFRLNVLDKYGITGEEIRRRNPRAIWVSSNAYGDQGSWGPLPGYEGSVQAATGMQVRYTSAEAPGSWPYAVHDYLTGYLTGLGVMLAVYARETTGAVLDVHGALLRTASLLQSEAWMELLTPDAQPGNNHGRIFEGLFHAKDGWVHLACSDEMSAARALGIEAGQELRAALGELAAGHTSKELVDRARLAGLAAHELAWVREIMAEPALQERGVSEVMHNHAGVLRWFVAPGPWMSLTPLSGRKIAKKPGSSQPLFGAQQAAGGR